MNRTIILAGFVVTSSIVCHVQPLPAQDSGTRPYITFETDYLFWSRDNQSDSGRVIGGPEGFGFKDNNFNYESGYRFDLGIVQDGFELEARLTVVDSLDDANGGFLARSITFDDGAASLLVDPSADANMINAGTFFSPLFAASLNPDPLGDLSGTDDETTEFEHLNAGAAYLTRYRSELEDIEINFKTADAESWFQVGLGYRNVQFNDNAMALVAGLFDTFDIDGDEIAANELNNGLSDAALTAAGYTLLGGAANGWSDDSISPTTLALQYNGRATNHLNGLQSVVDVIFYEDDRWILDGFTKLGIFHNHARTRVSETITPIAGDTSVYGRRFTDSVDTVSFIGNLGISGGIKITDNLRFTTGYEVMFLTNMALSPDQSRGMGYNAVGGSTYSAVMNGNVIAHGGKFGLLLVY